jgi:prephenate dehydrogenase
VAAITERRGGAEVAIIGLGVIGGSAALKLHERGTSLVTYAASDRDRSLAQAAGIAVAASLDEAVNAAGLVLIAVPIDRIASVATAVIAAAPSAATVLHAGSLQQGEAIGAVSQVTSRLIGTHPLAGSHRSGFAAANADLFRGATVFVERRASSRQREDAEMFWSLAGGARIEYATAEAHDRAMSWASHLPQLASTALAAAIADGLAHGDSNDLVPHGGPGARDATRLAMSALDVWQPILDRAPASTLDALRALEAQVGALRSDLERRDWNAVQETWNQGRAWRAAAELGEKE